MCRSLRRLVEWIGLFALVLGVGQMIPAHAAPLANTCNGASELSYPTAPNFSAIGDTIHVVIALGAGDITTGANLSLSINRVKFDLDCQASNLGINCLDDGPAISYQANLTSTCPGGFTTTSVAGDTLPNQVVFIPGAPIVIPANTPNFCRLEFDVKVEARGSNDGTPDVLEEVSGFDASTQDGVCNTVPPLAAGNTNSGSITLCPQCDDGNQCNGVETCNPATGCQPGTPITCDDNNVCTTDTCDPLVPAPGDPCVFTPGAQGDCNDNNVCTFDFCDPILGCVNQPGAQGDCNDNDVCTTDFCDPTNGCTHIPGKLNCDDSNVCTTDTCDPIAGCVNTPGALNCDDGNVCTTDTCNPKTGCVNTPGALDCDDHNKCTTDTCDPTAGCVNTPGALNCDDNSVCTTDTCDPVAGCVNTPGALNCDDSNVCTTDTCNPITGCVNTPGKLNCDDNNVCTTDTCNPTTGCVNTPGALDCDDHNKCTTDTCDPATGCVHTPGALDCDDHNKCTTDTCDPATGCVNTPGALNCDDNDPCTEDSCDPATGCQHVDNGQCNLICRTPGFWGTHADTDPAKACSQDITGAVIALAGGSISVCGECISNSNLGETLGPNDAASAEEALCVRVQGQSQRQLARQLTAAALNCIISASSSATCAQTSVIDWATCNAVCQGTSTAKTVGECIDEIDAFNNGIGTGCHDRDLPLDTIFPAGTRCTRNGQLVQGPAGSNDECNRANDSACTIIQPNESRCASDSCP